MRSRTLSRWASGITAARSRAVRAGLVTGIASFDVTSAGPNARERWILSPSRRRPLVPGTVTSMSRDSLGRRPHSAPALWWLSTARGPHASTAAIHRPCRLSDGCPTA